MSAAFEPRWGDPEAGTTLVEVLVAVMILGVGVVGLLSALAFLYKATDTHRQITTANALAQQAMEIVADPLQTPWAPCGEARSTYQGVLVAQGLTGGTVEEVQQWGNSGWQGCTGAAALPLQQITISASSPDGPGGVTMSVVKRDPLRPVTAQ